MANRRMLSKQIIDTDLFLNMPATSQNLYFHLLLRADDEGFISNPKTVSKMLGASEDDLKVLIGRQFLINFDSGVVVIKHWHIHNYIRKDRFKETLNTEEKGQITLNSNDVYERYTNGQPNDNQRLTQDRLGKDRLGKDNINIYIGEQAHLDTDNDHSKNDSQMEHIDEGSKDKSYAMVSVSNNDCSKSKSYTEAYKIIIDYLNEKAQSKFKYTTKATKSHINARLKEGFTVDDFKYVVDVKTNEWIGTEWEQYLRPNTLFGTKFESYLNQSIKVKQKSKNGIGKEQRDKAIDEVFDAIRQTKF